VTFCDRSTPTGIREGYDASDHNGVRRPPSAQEISHSVAATIYSVWRNQIIGQTLVATLARRGVALTTPREQQLTALKNLFDNFPTRQGHGASGLDFFDVRGVALAEQRRDIILLCSLADALTALAGPQFADAFNGSTNQSDYRWGRLHRVVLAHPLGGDFNIPPAAGQFTQPLGNLPGIPVDGGLFTVDVGNHPLGNDQSNGFMFTNGAARRYVGEVKHDSRRIRAVASLPGASGVPTSEFSVNLLPAWLTNETYRVGDLAAGCLR
jgi:penicillin G amidase